MPACAACGETNPSGFRFCGHCGAPLSVRACPSCGGDNPGDHAFCGQCGASLAGVPAVDTTRSAREERKLATVLFADIVGFTSLAERTDPEVVARTVDAAFHRLADVVVDHGGTVDKYMGDSVMAVFGVPQAHDDDAERAVAAALAMREVGGDLSFSIGVNSGEVMVTPLGPEAGMTVIGDTVNVAARLEKAAGPGEVLVGPLTAELAGRRVVLRARGPVLVKGKTEPLPVFEAVALRDAGADGAHVDATPLIGRDDELTFLLSQWRRARDDGRVQVVLVSGDGGCGKTRVVAELAGRISAAGEGRVIRAAYPGYGGLGGPRVAAEVVRQLGSTGDPQIDTRARSIAGELHPSLIGIDPGALKQEQMWAMRRLFEVKAADGPMLLLLDDVHRAGTTTLDLLAELARRLTDVSVLFVLAGRSEPADWLLRFPSATTVRIAPLSRPDATTLAAALVPSGELAPEAAALLVERSRGNPLHLRELVAVVAERGGLVRERDGAVRLAPDLPLPATLQAVLAARLDALEPAQKLAIQHVAVLGEAATAAQVAALGLPDAGAVLDSLVETGLLHHTDDCYDVADPLLREVAYESLPRSVRGERHRASAAIATSVTDRARHLGRAAGYLPDDESLANEAVLVLKDAASELRRTSRTADAARLLERAVELAPDDVEAILALAKVRFELVDPRASDTLDQLPADLEEPHAAERDHQKAAMAMFSDPARAATALDDVAARWEALDLPERAGWARANAGVALFNLSRMDESLAQLERARTHFERAADRGGQVAVYSFLSLVRPNDPRVPGWLAESLAWSEAAGDQHGQLNVLLSLSWHTYFRTRLGSLAEMDESLSWAARLVALGDTLGNPVMAGHGRALRASLLRLAGRLDDAAAVVADVDTDVSTFIGSGEFVLVRAVQDALAVARDPGAVVEIVGMSADPTVRAAGAILAESLALAGRFDDAHAQATTSDAATLLGRTGALFLGEAVVATMGATGPSERAAAAIDAVRHSAEELEAGPTRLAADALLAEVTGDTVCLPDEVPDSIAGALVLRARARGGDEAAAHGLVGLARRLAAPGLLVGLPTLT